MSKFEILIRPLVSEKSTTAREAQQKYSFQVRLDSSKDEIKNAVEKIYGVKVLSIRTQVTRSKAKRKGIHLIAATKGKKAIVTLGAGVKLPIFED